MPRSSTASVGLAVAAAAAALALLGGLAPAGADPSTTTPPTTAAVPTTTTTVAAPAPTAPPTSTTTAPKPGPGRAPVRPQFTDLLPGEVDYPSGARWNFTNQCGTDNGLPAGGNENSSAGLAIIDAASPASFDAFDCGAMLWIDNTVFADADDIVDIHDIGSDSIQIATSNPIDGLQLTQSYLLFPTGDTARTLLELQNPTGADISTPVSYVSNWGSDAGTVVAGSSSGDATFSTADRWIVTADDPIAGGDPINTTVLYGPGAVALTPTAVSTTVFNATTVDGALATFDVTVPAGQTRYLMFFQVLSGGGNGTPNAAAVTSAAVWNQPIDQTSPLLAGIPAADTALILNWAVAPAPVAAAPAASVGVVPTFAG